MNGKKMLVVEGGAMRGVFASGVLDAFLDDGYQPFSSAIGVSAGVCNLIGYLSNDRGRSIRVITELATQKEFFNPANFISGGHIADVKWLWEESKRRFPVNFRELYGSIPLYAAVTNIDSGEAEYFTLSPRNIDSIVEATTALPVVYKSTPCYQNRCYTDGGVADSIPVREAYRLGARDITVILSQPLSYQMHGPKYPRLVRALFAKQPHVAEAMLSRAQRYNESLDFIRHPPEDALIRVIAPPEGYNVKRFTMDKSLLTEGYQMGLVEGEKHLLALRNLHGFDRENCHFCV